MNTAISRQGTYAIAIGAGAGSLSQSQQSIVLRTSTSWSNNSYQTVSGFFAANIRSLPLGKGINKLVYDPTTYEIVRSSN